MRRSLIRTVDRFGVRTNVPTEVVAIVHIHRTHLLAATWQIYSVQHLEHPSSHRITVSIDHLLEANRAPCVWSAVLHSSQRTARLFQRRPR